MPDAEAMLTIINRKLDEVLNKLDDHEETLVEHTQKITNLDHKIRGNGQKGLEQRMARTESHLFANDTTKDIGVVAKVSNHEKLFTSLSAQLRLTAWLLGFAGTAGLAAIGRALFGS